jgi:type IV pilus assembly protein PilE
MKFGKGFTLIEIMVAIAIIGILASIAIPSYRDYVTRGKLVEASTNLSDLRIKIEQSFQDNRSYINYVNGSCNLLPAATTSAIVGAKYFTYTCVTTGTPNPDTYILTATSKANQGLGAAGDYTYTINETNAKVTIKFAGAALNQVPPSTCWIMSKGSSC